ncbi:hypothetical protein A2U01_0082973, partial [Trifolium medium]|nr:hypothetical protein [Trifolium medium]
IKPPKFPHVLPLARRAEASDATRRSCCEERFSFGCWRGAQLGLAQRAVPWCKGHLSSGVCATRS